MYVLSMDLIDLKRKHFYYLSERKMTNPGVNHFAVLGLKPGTSEEEIKRTYKSLAKILHPDKNNDPKAEEKFKNITNSYEVLKSKDRRNMHERELKEMEKYRRAKKYEKKRDYKAEHARRERDYDVRKRNDKRYDYYAHCTPGFSSGGFKSYDDEFSAFFSEKDSFSIRRKNPEDICIEFMPSFTYRNIDDMVKNLITDIVPSVNEKRTSQPRIRNSEEKIGHFKVPSSEFTSFYGRGDPFRDFE